jgi:hypothetical protein
LELEMTKALAIRPERELYTDQIASEILDRLADGITLTNICEDDHLPSRITVWRWTQGRNGAPEEFRGRYLEARTAQADKYFDEIMSVARETMERPSNDRTNANRLFVDTVKWQLAKMRPNVYGDQARIHLGADSGAPPVQTASVRVDLSAFDESEKKQLRELARKAITGGGGKPELALPAISEEAPVDRKAPFVPPNVSET